MSDNTEISSAAIGINPNTLYYNDTRENKQWYLDGSSLSSLSVDVYSVWKDYIGTGIKIGVIDSQIDYTHTDLKSAYDRTLDYNFALKTNNPVIDPQRLPLFHGTSVAGVISAEANNAFGTVGIASGASLVGLAVDYSSSTAIEQIVAALNKATELDVVNNSWSFASNFADDFNKNPAYEDALEHAVSQGRGGLGTSVVFAAGNAGGSGSSNYHNFQNSPYAIAVGAVDPSGAPSSFTSLGANVLISAGGRDIYTTALKDRFDTFNGTSFAAPAVSGAVGLMLEANPTLGYRDVQEILAYSARREGLSEGANFGDGWRTNGADNFNGGGLHFSDAFGYGFLNIHDAVRLAETWSKQQTYANLSTITETVEVNRQLVAGANDHISVNIEVGKVLDVEHVQLAMDLRWLDTGDLDVYLTSPDGTQVRLVYDLPGAVRVGNIRNFTFDSVASMGEQSAGTWKLDIYNRNPKAVDKSGVPLAGELQDVTLTISGSAQGLSNDVYVYTDEFGTLYDGSDLATRSVLRDTDGGADTINAAAVTSAVMIDLSAGRHTIIAGVTLALDPNAIENAFSGDGNDTLIGSSIANTMAAGRGDDVLYFSFGKDLLDGGQGKDTLVLGCALGTINGQVTAGGDLAISARYGEVSTVCNVETFVFSDGRYSYADLVRLFGSSSAPTTDEAASQPEDSEAAGSGTTNGAVSTPPAGFDETVRSYEHSLTGTGAGERIGGTGAADRIDGMDGDDILFGRDGDDALHGSVGDDKLTGGGGADFLDGGSGFDRLYGDLGLDKLCGGAGGDLLKGGDGNDWIAGGSGSDRLYGEGGADTFVFDIADLDGLDTIYDFDAAEGDTILVTGLPGAANATFEFVSTAAGTFFEMHDDSGITQIARLKGEGSGDLAMSSTELGLIWA